MLPYQIDLSLSSHHWAIALSWKYQIHTNLAQQIIYSYFMATRGTVKLWSRGSGEDLGNCCQRPKAISITEGQWFDCSPSSLEITVLLPNCFKSPKHCHQYADTRH